MKLYLLRFNYSVDHEYDCSDILGIFDSMKKAELFKYFCLGKDIDTISSAHDKKNRYFSCLMTDREFAEAKAFCDKFCKPGKAEEKCNREVICIIIEETRIIYV